MPTLRALDNVSRPSVQLAKQAIGVTCAAISDVGMRRSNNQDSLAVCLAPSLKGWQERGHLFVVADGMGAHAAGELASQIATENIPHTYEKLRDTPPMEAAVAAVEDANRRIYARGKDSVDFHGMGTTCSCLLLLPEGAVAAHVGDSRVYRLRGTLLEQLTFDHSLVWEMSAASHSTEDQVPAYVPRNVITRSLGPHPTVKVDVEGPLPIALGDRFLVCSDGLTGPLSAELIGMVISALPPQEAAQTLVDLANLLGGPDNISVVVVEALNLTSDDKVSAPASTRVRDGLPGQTSGSRTSPTTDNRKLHNGALVGAFCCAALSAAAAFFGSWWLALASGAGALGLALVGVGGLKTSSKNSFFGGPVGSTPQGKAPYRRYDVSLSGQKIESLGEIVRQIEDLEAQKEWGFDWRSIHEDRGAALQAIGRGDLTAAVIAYSSAVRRLMKALREHQEASASDSTINLDRD